jgi:hypothetical protein
LSHLRGSLTFRILHQSLSFNLGFGKIGVEGNLAENRFSFPNAPLLYSRGYIAVDVTFIDTDDRRYGEMVGQFAGSLEIVSR